MEQFWARLASSPCIADLSGIEREWFALVRAVSQRDPGGMATSATKGDGFTGGGHGHSDNACLVARLGQQRPEQVVLAHRVMLAGIDAHLERSPRKHVRQSRQTRGVFHSLDSTLYVSRGIGMAGLPLRINCPREIALLQPAHMPY